MQLAAPTSIEHVASDGAIGQADIDASFNALLGKVTATEISRETDGTFDVRFGREDAPDLTYPAQRVAQIVDDEWLWTSQSIARAGEGFGIAELNGSQPAACADLLTRAARTIYANAPIIRIPFRDATEVLVLEVPVVPSTPDVALLRCPIDVSERQLAAYGAQIGLNQLPAQIRDGALYSVGTPSPGQLTLDDIRADSFYLAREHQLFLEAISTGPTVVNGFNAIVPTRRGAVVAPAQAIATINEDTWTWTSHARPVLTFGQKHRIPALMHRQLPSRIAREWNLIDCAKIITNRWTHSFASVEGVPGEWAVILFDRTTFSLPPAEPSTVSAVLSSQLPSGLSQDRANHAYRRLRGV